jgi:hypothetical protein
MKFTILITLLGISTLNGCGTINGAMKSCTSNTGTPAEIKCYSGGNLIYEGNSTGKPASEASSDGYYWTDSETGRLVEASADCIFIYE